MWNGHYFCPHLPLPREGASSRTVVSVSAGLRAGARPWPICPHVGRSGSGGLGRSGHGGLRNTGRLILSTTVVTTVLPTVIHATTGMRTTNLCSPMSREVLHPEEPEVQVGLGRGFQSRVRPPQTCRGGRPRPGQRTRTQPGPRLSVERAAGSPSPSRLLCASVSCLRDSGGPAGSVHTQDLLCRPHPPEGRARAHRCWARSPWCCSRVWRLAPLLLAEPMESAFIVGRC